MKKAERSLLCCTVVAERAARGVHQAIEAGALRFLSSSVVRGAFFEDELPYQKELYAQAFHQLLMGFLDAEPGRRVLSNALIAVPRTCWHCSGYCQGFGTLNIQAVITRIHCAKLDS